MTKRLKTEEITLDNPSIILTVQNRFGYYYSRSKGDQSSGVFDEKEFYDNFKYFWLSLE